MSGNITEEGIKLDLEWMHRVGIAGFQNFDAALQTPQVVEKRLVYMTPEWKDAFKYAIHIGDQFGMEMAIAGSPGWSESGGPWVPPSHAMKKYVWSETFVNGGQHFTGNLAHPPANTGAFQNMGIIDRQGRAIESSSQFYADAAVVAFRVPSSVSEGGAAQPTITSGGDGLDASMLSDGDLQKTTNVPIPAAGEESWIQFQYPSEQTIRAITFVTRDPSMMAARLNGIGAPEKTLEASDDGQTFYKVAVSR
jgi:alpha-L-rhamnosidase